VYETKKSPKNSSHRHFTPKSVTDVERLELLVNDSQFRPPEKVGGVPLRNGLSLEYIAMLFEILQKEIIVPGKVRAN
jgi:hypothetical protein